jgi:hypothetical protein
MRVRETQLGLVVQSLSVAGMLLWATGKLSEYWLVLQRAAVPVWPMEEVASRSMAR